jgi:hypothetical protein
LDRPALALHDGRSAGLAGARHDIQHGIDDDLRLVVLHVVPAGLGNELTSGVGERRQFLP